MKSLTNSLFQGGFDGGENLLQLFIIVNVTFASLLGVDQGAVDSDFKVASDLPGGFVSVLDVVTKLASEVPTELIALGLVPSPAAIDCVYFHWCRHICSCPDKSC